MKKKGKKSDEKFYFSTNFDYLCTFFGKLNIKLCK